MAGSSLQAWRKLWWQIHKWIALALMIALIPLALSGAVLAWDDRIDHAINPGRYAATGAATLAPSAYAAAARHVLAADDRVTMIRYPGAEGGPVTVAATRVGRAGGGHGGPPVRSMVWLDPGTARVLGAQIGNSGLVRMAHMLHGSFFLPGPGVGRAFIGLLGVAMTLLAATGIWLWWPTIGSVAKGLRWRRGDRRLETNLHHRIGIWIALPLAFQAFTGTWIAWPQMMAMIGAAPARQGGPGGGRPGPAGHVRLTPERALAAARTIAPGAPASIAWPAAGPDPAWRIAVDGARGEVTVDDATGAAAAAPPRPQDLAALVRHLHDGGAIGWGWRLAMLLWALAPAALGITGLIMWLRGRRWRADLRHRQRARGRVRPAAAE